MTEVASLLPADHRLSTVRHHEAGPPEGLELDPRGRPPFKTRRITYSSRIFLIPQVEPGETFATTKEEEWISKKKTEVTNTKQIETRVKRQVVLEDGKVVEDSGPMVSTNTTEDTEKKEHHQTELRKLGLNDDEKKAIESGGENWVAVPNPDGVVREVKEKKVISREETEEVKETEDVQHFGDITDEDFLSAVRTGREDLRQVLKTNRSGGVVSTGPRLVKDSIKSQKVTDTENLRELSSVLPNGKIITETERTTEHEEVKDDELPEGAPDQNYHKESSERYRKTRDQEDVDYLQNGVKVGHEMRFKDETMEVERRGDGLDETDFDSLSAQARRRNNNNNNQQPIPQRHRLENGFSPLDRKDAITRRPLDFDQEEETRKLETNKWLEHHFGSESRSSNNSTIDEEEQPPKTSFFNVTIKSQPRIDSPQKSYVSTPSSRVYTSPSPVEPERERNEYYKGISEWSERKETYNYQSRPSPVPDYRENRKSPVPDYRENRKSPVPDYAISPSPDYREYRDYRGYRSPSQEFRNPVYNNRSPNRTPEDYRRSPVPDYREYRRSPVPDYRTSPKSRDITPTPPQRKKAERKSRYQPEEPPPDYSPPNPPPMPSDKKANQKTRFAPDPPKAKSTNIIGQSIRKLVGKIRSASAERKAKQRAKRSPSPSYQKGHVIDNIERENGRPLQRYYLGEDPFAGSIYGRENKYDGVKPARSRRKEEDGRSQSTLGRFSKSTGRLVNTSPLEPRNSQTLPRQLTRRDSPSLKKTPKSNSTINVSIVNTLTRPLKNDGPAKPARTYKSNLSRSKSLTVRPETRMYTSSPHLHRLDENPVGLKSPGLISSLSRSQKDLHNEDSFRFRNGYETKFATKSPEPYYMHEPPTRLRDTPPQGILRRGSTSSTDFSETYHTTTRNDNPLRPTVTNTTKSFSKKTIPSRNGRSVETIESSETKSVTKSYRGSSPQPQPQHYRVYEKEMRFNGRAASPVIIEVRNNYRK